MSQRMRRFTLHPTLIQALLEAWLIGGLGLLALTSQLPTEDTRTLSQAILFLMPLVALWYALRVPIVKDRSLSHQVVYEVGAALALSPLATSTWLLLLRAFELWTPLRVTTFGPVGTILLILAVGPFFLGFRTVIGIWDFWKQLRRRHLMWALTHTQLQLIILLGTLWTIAMAVSLILVDGRRLIDLDTWIFTLFPLASIVIVVAPVGLGVVLPPALLLGWLTARRTTQRLQDLIRATAAVREGRFETQVAVQGEDEVAQLQEDFNAMAAALEHTMLELQAERDKVSTLLESRRQLIASVSHELRTPVATLRGYLESLQHNPASGDLNPDLEIMEHEIQRLQTLISDLFTLSRAEVGELRLDLTPVDIVAVAQTRVKATARLAWERDRIEVLADVPSAPLFATADEGRLEQILINLLRNALQHTPPGGIVAVSAKVEDECVCIGVCDTGKGIPLEEQQQIWERFYRGAQSQNGDHHGVGLGLALVKELTEAMGGRVAVESAAETGSCFRIWLPKAPSPELS